MRALRILVLAGETPDLGPRATLWGLCLALRDAQPDIELTTTLPDETAGEDPAPPLTGLRAACAVARRHDLVLLTNDALADASLRGAVLPPVLARLRATTAGVALVQDVTRTRIGGWMRAHSLRALGVITAADERSARNLQALDAGRVTLLPDPALLVPAAFADAARATLAAAGAPMDGTPVLGVVPRPVAVRGESGAASAERLIASLARVLELAALRHGTYAVCLPAGAADLRLCEALAARVGADRAGVAPLLDPKTFRGVASETVAMLCAHRRAALLAAGVGRPTIALGDASVAGGLEGAGPGHAFLDSSLFLRGGLTAQVGELIDAALEARRAPVLRIEELQASVRAGVRGLLRIVE